MKKERLLYTLGDVDEKYIKEAEPTNMNKKALIKIAVCACLVIALSLYLFIPFAPVTSNLTAYADSEYYPLIEGIEDYRLGFMQPKNKNNFENLLDFFAAFGNLMAPNFSAPDMNDSAAPGNGANGNYVESTDNQVEGVVESDLFKMTDKYIFRIGYSTKETYQNGGNVIVLRVYSIDKENSALISEFAIPQFKDERTSGRNPPEIYLSEDCNTVTMLKSYTTTDSKSKVGIMAIDVSDVENISVKKTVIIDGALKTTRMVDGKLLLVSEFYFNRNNVDYNDPATFVPTIDSGEGKTPVKFEDIIFPEQVGNTRYSVVAMIDGDSLELLGANALLNFISDVYVSENNIYITREYTGVTEEEDVEITENRTDIAVLNYSGDTLENRGIITAKGNMKDQYSFDEKDGYLRVVSSTLESRTDNNGNTVGLTRTRNASLYIFSLQDNSLMYAVEDFAIQGESVTSVRFDGDELYVCTAVVQEFTDPVYFFDLSDYENITISDTGVIEGYSDSLIDLGEGFLLGIGRENWQYGKVEIYEQQGDKVVSVAEFKFTGEYSLDYKSYLVNREENIFGFGVEGYFDENNQHQNNENVYILLQFNGYELTPMVFDVRALLADYARAAYVDGYLYITTRFNFTVEKIY